VQLLRSEASDTLGDDDRIRSSESVAAGGLVVERALMPVRVSGSIKSAQIKLQKCHSIGFGEAVIE
jgi:hypothetical protein